MLGKLRGSCPSGVAERNVNSRADTVIFLFLVTCKCTERSVRGEGERESETQIGQRVIQTEEHMGRDAEGGRKGRGGTESYRHQEKERNQTRDETEVML